MTDPRIEKLETRLRKARVYLMTKLRFYGVLLTGLEDIVEAKNDTACTDGKVIYWSPDFIEELTDLELVFVLAHEAAHCALLHHVRRGDRDPMIWNCAGDYVINLNLVAERVGEMPDKGLLDQKYSGMSVEDVYDALEQQAQAQQPQPGQDEDGDQDGDQDGQGGSQDGQNEDQSGEGQGQPSVDPGGCGGVMDASEDQDAHEEAEQKEVWQRIAQQAAAVQARTAGHVGGMGKLMLDNLGDAQTNWEDELEEFIAQSQVKVWDWSELDRRFTDNRAMMPGQIDDASAQGVLFVDTSGSMQDEQLKRIFEEIKGILGAGIIQKIIVVEVDSRVTNVTEYEADADISGHEVKGRGGTMFQPAWDWLEETEEPIDFAIYFTDLYPCDGFGREPEVPLLWAASAPSYDRGSLRSRMDEVPFGRCIEVK